MKSIEHNDNELIYLMKMNNENAFSMLVSKYSRFIYSKINEYDLVSDEDDCFQEAIICLYNAANHFDDKYNKSFMKYFEQLLVNKLLDIRRIKNREKEVNTSSYLIEETVYVINEDSESYKSNLDFSKTFLKSLTDIEKIVFEEYFLKNIPITKIALEKNIETKKIYYAIYRIKIKIKKYMVK